VDVPVEQEHGSVGHNRIEVLLARQALRERIHRPAAAQHPRVVRPVGCVLRDREEVRLSAVQVIEEEVQQVAARKRWVHVRVLETREQHSAVGLDDTGRQATGLMTRARPDRVDPAGPYDDVDRFGAPSWQPSSKNDEIRGWVGHLGHFLKLSKIFV
jgi:hypothetical protein